MSVRYNLGDLPPEIRARIIVNPATGCWEWQFRWSTRTPDCMRYAAIMWRGRPTPVHRVTYTLLVEPIPEDFELDHVYALSCRSHACCWPAHLEPVTPAENSARGQQANIGRGVARTVQRRIAYGLITDRDRVLVDAAWMLPFPRTGEPDREPPAPEPPRQLRPLYTMADAAPILDVTVEELDAWRRQGSGPLCFKVGRKWLYRHETLMAFKDQ